MPHFRRTAVLPAVTVLALTLGLAQIALESYAEARAGGGRSGGFRGSRSYSAPARPSRPASSPATKETPAPTQQAAPFSPQGGGFMRGIAGGLMGGLLGSLLFSGLANAGWGGLGGSGFGGFEILLLAGLGYFLYRKFRGAPALAGGSAAMRPQSAGGYNSSSTYSSPVEDNVALQSPDFSSILMMDRSFDPGRFLKSGQELFFKVQGAWNRQDAVGLAALCAPELMRTWQQELADLRARGRKNRMENIALSSSEISEAWTETGQDYITVCLRANLLDYTVDEKSGAVVEGSDSEPVEFEEFWTFTRPVGPNPWKLAAVQQA